MAGRGRVTITDIAAMCGVSVQTVSRVVNGKPDVSAETRAAVEAAIARHGYEPSALARSMVSRRSHTIGLVAAGLHLTGVAQVLMGVADRCDELGYGLLLKELRAFEPTDIRPILRFFAARQVEGVIFDGAQLELDAANIQASVPAGSPDIVFLKCEPSPRYTTVSVDNAGGQADATRHLIGLGRRRIGYVSGPRGLLESRQRQDGWARALDAAGLPTGPVVEGDWSSASGASALDALLRLEPAMDAVAVANDQMALGLMHRAADLGVAVPEDLAVTGFDGVPEGAYFRPSLTTAVQPLRDVGMAAVTALLAQVEGEAEPGRAITLTTDLVIRASAPAAASGAAPDER